MFNNKKLVEKMKEIKIEHLAYLLKQAKDKKQPQPIFFLGAGASRSGDIPSAIEIVNQILDDYSESPFVQDLPSESRTYANLMNCLLPDQRDELLKKYIDEAKINVTHIYLAQLLKEGYVDYILTVNFDNLMLRALALFNIFPSTYDMAILKDLTTTSFKEKSVVYLHGQNHGLWLLNTPAEMEKVKNTVPRIFDAIKNKRPWVFIGYSGEDPIFEHVKKLGRFNNGLYWVTYNDHNPKENIQEFLSEPNTNAFVIKGYDSDSFMLKLNSELKLGQPYIIDKPFTALMEMLNEIVDIEDKEHFKGVKERLEISIKQVQEAINLNELGIIEPIENIKENTEIDLLKKDIINLIISNEYNEKVISEIEEKVKSANNQSLELQLSSLYLGWGNHLQKLSTTEEGKKLDDLKYQSIEKYQKAIAIRPNFYEAYHNWGVVLENLAKLKEGKEKDELYHQSFEKYEKTIKINPDYNIAYFNWGISLENLAKFKEGKEAEKLIHQAIEKYQKVIAIKPDHSDAYNNWGGALAYLAKSKEGKEADLLYHQSFDKFQKAIEIKPDLYQAYYLLGVSLGDLAKTKKGKEAEELYNQSFKNFKKVIIINPNFHEVYYNWGIILRNLAKTLEGIVADELYHQSFEKFQKSFELGGKCYNLACFYAIKENKEDALHYLDLSLRKKEITIEFVKTDDDWQNYLQDLDFKNILKKHEK